jgi:cation diffusion facilitator CzcD-associated flavoprotein CzcO
VLRVSRHEGARFHVGSPLVALDEIDSALAVTTPKGHYVVDFLIFATGFHSDIATRAEFSPFARFVRRWKDRYQADPALPSYELAESPDLGAAFAFQEREPGTCAALTQIHCFNHAASLSHGKLSGDIPAISDGAQRLARGIASRLFDADRERHYQALLSFDTSELRGDEWSDADASSDTSRARLQAENAAENTAENTD